MQVREFDAYSGLDTALKNFNLALPCVADLRAPSMRERHWSQLMSITKVHFEMDAAFALRDLLSLQLHVYADDVSEVVDRALKEDKMEQAPYTPLHPLTPPYTPYTPYTPLHTLTHPYTPLHTLTALHDHGE